MCKHLLFLCVFLFASLQLSYAENVKDDSSKQNGKHPYKEVTNVSDEFAHWSLTLEGGLNLIDGDFVQDDMTILPKSRVRPTGAISLTYDFTPTWGLVGMYSYAAYGVKADNAAKDDWLQKGQMHTIEALASFDLVNAWFPYRKKDIFSFYFLAGLGLGFYNSAYYGGVEPVYAPQQDKYGMAGVFALGAAAEFNITRSLGLGVKGLYHIYTIDNIDARIKGNNNDCMEYANLYVRWKIETKHKNHQRNFANTELLIPELSPKAQEKFGHVPPQKDTIVSVIRDTIVVKEQIAQETIEPQIVRVVEQQLAEKYLNTAAQCYYLYFENNKAALSDEALCVIQQAAARLEADSTICLEIAGYCDNTGSEEYNQRLAQQRIQRVVREFVQVYNVEDERLFAVAKGKVDNVDAAYKPNRRVEIRLSSKQEIQQLRQAQTEQVDEVKHAVLKEFPVKETIVSNEMTTFARLANVHYGNVFCWPYIYAKNQKAVMRKDPNRLMQDVEIVIPLLSDAEIQAATPEAVSAMLEAIRTNVNIQL